nr:immunoglobulin light chain junction region [Macaca mulatta]
CQNYGGSPALSF